ncbi:secretory carrier-associated membrane protein 4 isoform X1 [Erinaceus europaeus]|uniref:Secretory carrier-associated membrane protein n=1 Tax=Erinaceus europaeus TaxID=9365 RepID=A0ABM3WNA2_ERIEU|nr:secretory carrier-associated membrane protein 4 isoform X1 [Erinaceus europaeus]
MPGKENNFPPLPGFLPLRPCFYQNVTEEIPAEHQVLVKRIYRLWLFYCLTLAVNLAVCLLWWVAGGAGANFGLALLWLLLFSPCAYVCWFRPAYKAFRGWLAAVGFFQVRVWAAVFMLVPAVMFTVAAAAMAFVILKVHRIYRGGGGSLQKAQTEWSSGTWRDPPSREAQFNFSGNSLPEYPTVPSYPAAGGQWP